MASASVAGREAKSGRDTDEGILERRSNRAENTFKKTGGGGDEASKTILHQAVVPNLSSLECFLSLNCNTTVLLSTQNDGSQNDHH